jgi:single-stranded DNA-binding protein
MLSVLLEGTLTAAPASRTSIKGQPYTTAKVRATAEDGETLWASVIAFGTEPAEALAALASGDAVAIAGHAALNTWEKDGKHYVGLKVTATRVLSVYAAGKRRSVAGRNVSRSAEGT